MDKNLLKVYIQEAIDEILKEDEGTNTSSSVGSYLTPFAFGKPRKFSKTILYKLGYRLANKNPLKKSKMFDKVKYEVANPKYKNDDENKKKRPYIPTKIYENLDCLIRKQLSEVKNININESYNKFRKNIKSRTSQEQLKTAVYEIKRKLKEVNRLLEYTTQMKQELSENEGSVKNWKTIEKSIKHITENAISILRKIKNFR